MAAESGAVRTATAAGGPGPGLVVPPAPPVTMAFPGTLDQVTRARRFLASLVGQSAPAGDTILCLSELVTNAIMHSASGQPGGFVTVRAVLTPSRLLCEVTDQGGPWRLAADRDGQSGRGLVIVEALATSFGITGDDAGRTIWFTMDLA